MIFNLTHRLDGSAIQRLAITTKVAIGMPKSENTSNYPKKLDHFYIESKDVTGAWVQDKALTRTLQEKYSRKGVNDKGEEAMTPLREFDVVFISDDIEEVFTTELAWWSASEKKCSGDGRQANRVAAIVKDKALLDAHPGQRYVPWTPCGDACIDKQEKRCKPSGSLLFMLLDRPVIGSVCSYFTTSYRTIIQIHSSLEQVKKLTGGRLRGIPLRMVIRPGKTSYQDAQGARKTSNAFFVHLEFRQADHTKLLPQLLESSIQYDRAKLEQVSKVKQLTGGVKVDPEPTVTPLSEAEQGTIMEGEFYPGDEVGDVPDEAVKEEEAAEADEMEIVEKACSKWNINKAQREVAMSFYKGDVEPIVEFFKVVDAEFSRLQSNAKEVQEFMQRFGMNPPNLVTWLKGCQMGTPAAATQPAAEAPKRGRPRKADAPPETPTGAPPVAQPSAKQEEVPPTVTPEPSPYLDF